MFCDRDGFLPIEPDADLVTLAQSQGEDGDQPGESFGVSDVGIFQIEPTAFHRREQPFRFPAFFIICQGCGGRMRGHDDDMLTAGRAGADPIQGMSP